MKIGFDNDKYLKMQSEHIRERINQFGNKLYMEFGGKLFDDYHASRVLPGFARRYHQKPYLQCIFSAAHRGTDLSYHGNDLHQTGWYSGKEAA